MSDERQEAQHTVRVAEDPLLAGNDILVAPLDCWEAEQIKLTVGKGPVITFDLWCIVGLRVAVPGVEAQRDDLEARFHIFFLP